MEFFIGDATAGVVFGILGIKMCLLAIKTGKAPERLLAVCFLGWSVAYLSYTPLFALPDGSVPPIVPVCAALGDVIGSAACGVFIMLVFRRQEIWARWVTVTVIACMIVGVSGRVLVDKLDMLVVISSPYFFLYRGSLAALFCWLSIEAATAYVEATKRRRIGLSAAMSCNRFFLVSLAAAMWVTVEFVEAYDAVVFALTGTWFPPMDYLLGVAEFSSVAMFWLAFLPPKFYRNWIESHDRELEHLA